MRYSFQRAHILQILRNSTEHYSVEQVHKELLKEIPNVSLMTVYRNLTLLAKKGDIIPLHINNAVHYCGDVNPHYHLECLNCGEVSDFYNSELLTKNKLLDYDDFSPARNGILFRGICSDCKKAEA